MLEINKMITVREIREKFIMLLNFNDKDVYNIPLLNDSNKQIKKAIDLFLNEKDDIKSKIYQMIVENTYHDELYCEILNHFENVSAYHYSMERWNTLTTFFISNGLFRLGLICRQKAESAIELKHSPKYIYKNIIVCIENGDLDKAQNLFKIIDKRPFNSFSEIKLLSEYLNIINGKTSLEKADFNYRNYLQGKKVKIIGPLMSEKDNQSKNEDEIIVRNNVKVNQKETVNVSYYNYDGFSKIKNDLGVLIKKIDYIVVKAVCGRIEKHQNVHMLDPWYKILFLGDANMLPMMILDLRKHGVENITVWGNNLFCSKKIHSSDYMFGNNENYKYMRSLAAHDMISNFKIIKRMYLAGIISVDPILRNVLDLSLEEYVEEMEKIHGIRVKQSNE